MYDRAMATSKPRRSPKPQERQRDPERTRGLILRAAAEEFAAHGYSGARVSAIAARAGVNQQLISYYFDGKEGLYQAMSQAWAEREDELVADGAPLSEQMRRFAAEAAHDPAGARLLAWSGLEYAGPASDPDQAPRAERLGRTVERIKAAQAAGAVPAQLDPACVTVALMAAAMATTTLPNVLEGVCGVDPRSPEFVAHYADQVALMARLLGLDADQTADS